MNNQERELRQQLSSKVDEARKLADENKLEEAKKLSDEAKNLRQQLDTLSELRDIETSVPVMTMQPEKQ